MTKLFAKPMHQIMMLCSPKYRKAYALEQGGNIWRKLDEKLPGMMYIKQLDEPRVKKFAAMVAELTPEEQQQLKMWLAEQVWYWKHNFSEHTTATVERVEWQLRYGYQLHLEVLEPKEGN